MVFRLVDAPTDLTSVWSRGSIKVRQQSFWVRPMTDLGGQQQSVGYCLPTKF